MLSFWNLAAVVYRCSYTIMLWGILFILLYRKFLLVATSPEIRQDCLQDPIESPIFPELWPGRSLTSLFPIIRGGWRPWPTRSVAARLRKSGTWSKAGLLFSVRSWELARTTTGRRVWSVVHQRQSPSSHNGTSAQRMDWTLFLEATDWMLLYSSMF